MAAPDLDPFEGSDITANLQRSVDDPTAAEFGLDSPGQTELAAGALPVGRNVRLENSEEDIPEGGAANPKLSSEATSNSEAGSLKQINESDETSKLSEVVQRPSDSQEAEINPARAAKRRSRAQSMAERILAIELPEELVDTFLDFLAKELLPTYQEICKKIRRNGVTEKLSDELLLYAEGYFDNEIAQRTSTSGPALRSRRNHHINLIPERMGITLINKMFSEYLIKAGKAGILEKPQAPAAGQDSDGPVRKKVSSKQPPKTGENRQSDRQIPVKARMRALSNLLGKREVRQEDVFRLAQHLFSSESYPHTIEFIRAAAGLDAILLSVEKQLNAPGAKDHGTKSSIKPGEVKLLRDLIGDPSSQLPPKTPKQILGYLKRRPSRRKMEINQLYEIIEGCLNRLDHYIAATSPTPR